MYDCIVVGAGPAGLSAAVNVRQRGGSVICIGTPKENNPLWKAGKVDNYLGMPSLSGAQMLEAFTKHALEAGVTLKTERVLNAFYNGTNWMVSAGSDVLEAYSIVFAGGVARGKTWPGEEEYIGRGVSYCATCDGMLYRGREVLVIGFGSADREEAEYLESIGCHVTYKESPRKVVINGETKVTGAVADGEEISCDAVFVLRPSFTPDRLFPGIELDGNYIKVDDNMAASLPGLFAAGDCTGKPLQVAKAVGQGLIAGQSAAAFAAEAKKRQ